MDEVKLVSSVLTSDITPTNIVLYLEKLKELNNLLIIQYKAELIQYRDIQMKDYIQERCDDLMNNKKKMINSFMNREIKSIILNQLKKEVNNHFQHIVGSTNQEKILSGIWIDQYSPRNYVDENIYDGLIDHITQEEIEYHISLLPNGKASGPSRVSYKMIKHSSSEMKTYIKDYLNECLTLKKIPKENNEKALVSILNRRCSKIFKGNNVLRGNQFAGLEGNSTFEPIRIIKEIIQNAIENKKELWILALDMAKAYGYEITVKYKKDIYSDYIKESIIFSGKTYINDTTLLAKDQLQLETMLDIANEFYSLNDIKINKDKSELLLKKIDKSFNYSNSLMIRFGSEYINIKPKVSSESIRILSVWFNVNDDKNVVLSQAKSEVKKLIDNIKHKRISDKQLQYIFNALIIPTIEYRTQVTILNDRKCESIMSPFRRAFRKKLRFSWWMPTAIINHNLIYNIKDITDNQLQAKNISVNNKLSIEKYKITGDNVTIRNILGTEKFFNNIHRIKKDGVMFLDQLIGISNSYLINWCTLKLKSFREDTRNYIKPKKWYRELQNIVTIDGKTLKPEYKISAVSHFKGYNMAQCEIDRNNIPKKLTFIGIWNNRNNNIEIGVLIIIGHLNVINNVNFRSSVIQLQKCSGYELDNIEQLSEKNYNCNI
ncbi:hypothetical protein GLOIN_2v1873210 [Rhizophagus irregularis DAOM 181602=DAOM 197198]|nr:hypothetical protein GLOIN_2v1873210 [Rhizophagus irregularis DAOM 181602=DAOM 197198]